MKVGTFVVTHPTDVILRAASLASTRSPEYPSRRIYRRPSESLMETRPGLVRWFLTAIPHG